MKPLLVVILSILSLTIKSQTYYIVRHAEKASGGMAAADNPPLTDAGKQRAVALRDFLKDKNIGYIFSTNTLRTISTATPLSEAIGKPVTIYNRMDQALVDSLKSLHKNALIVGHSNTVDDIVNIITKDADVPGDLPDNVYDNLYIITVEGSKISFKTMKYGKPSENK